MWKDNECEFETHGKRASSTLCPVSRGWLAGSFSVTGLTCRTGHTCTMVNFSFTPSNSSSSTTSWHTHTTKREVPVFSKIVVSSLSYILRSFSNFVRHYTNKIDVNDSHVHVYKCEIVFKDSVTHRNVIISWRSEVGDCSPATGGQHDLVLDERVLIHQSIDITPCNVTSNLKNQWESPIKVNMQYIISI